MGVQKIQKNIPVLYVDKKGCTGCTACYSICAASRKRDEVAIYMQADEEGFEYPVIDETKCVRCYLCVKVCPLSERKIRAIC